MTQDWTVNGAIEEADRFVKGLGFPKMQRPTGLGEEYAFPTSARQLTSTQLGDLSLKLGSWYSWLLEVLGKEETEFTAFETVFELKVSAASNTIRRGLPAGRAPAQEVLRALAIEQDQQLLGLQRTLILRRAKIQRLEAQAKIYTEQLSRLSREQSRRDTDARGPGGG